MADVEWISTDDVKWVDRDGEVVWAKRGELGSASGVVFKAKAEILIFTAKAEGD